MNNEEIRNTLDQQINRILDDDYDPQLEGQLTSMIKDFYNRKMLSTIIIVWGWGLLCGAGAILSARAFFGTEDVSSQIMYATIFTCSVIFIAILKVFAWQMIHRNAIVRDIKRLELRIVELAKSVAEKS